MRKLLDNDDKYMQYSMRPHIHDEIKANYKTITRSVPLALSLQSQLHAADMALPPAKSLVFPANQ